MKAHDVPAALGNVSERTSIAGGSAISPADLGNGVLSPLTLGLVSCGGIGALLFTATYLIEGITRPGYDVWQQPISALSLGPGGWVQQVNFAVYGILLMVSAVGWYRFLAPGRGRDAIWFPLLQGTSGLCLIGAGLFSMDPFPGYPPGVALAPATAHGTLHAVLAYAIIITLAQGCFVMGAHFSRLPYWRGLVGYRRGWALYSMISGVLILIFWGAFVQDVPRSFGGLDERLSAGSHDLWICLLTATLLVQYRIRSRQSADGDS